MTEEELKAIEGRAGAAPEGGFTVDESGFLRPVHQVCTMEGHQDCAVGQMVWLSHPHGDGFNRELAAFFASAGTDVSALISEVRRLQLEVVRARDEGIEEAARAVLAEHLEDPQDESDAAYDMAIDHAAAAVRELKGEEGRISGTAGFP